MNDLATIKNKRKELEQQFQDDYNSKTSYTEKLEYIYNLLFKSQQYYLKYTGNNTFDEKYLSQLTNNLQTTKNLNDDIFVDFIKENIISKIKCGHIYIVPHKLLNHKHDEISLEQSGPNVEYRFEDKTVILKIKSFHKSIYKRDKPVFEELQKILHKKQIDNVIIDIRGNGGGTDQYFDYFSIFTSQKHNRITRFKNLFTDENEMREWTVIKGLPDSKEYNRYLLVDERVFSATDSFARFCKQTGFATVIGRPTRGEGYGMTIFRIQITDSEYNGKHLSLPATVKGIEMAYPIDAPLNEQGEIDYENLYRTTPDIICTTTGPLTVALQEIEKKKLENKSMAENKDLMKQR
ncbi:MAG: S41 family peptidase [Clostridia bacterium]|nr:S41 family peptidase [Clostridia bacterium]MDD4686385.1 S41 family peptidase [Clostridia bacterium]